MAKKTRRIDNDDRKLYAFISSFFTIVGFIIALILWRKDKYIMHYAKHGLVLFIAQAVIIVLGPFLYFLSSVLWVLWVILWIVSWMNSFSGKIKKTFLIGDLADKIIL
jgi:uncharacterized membrane protein